MCRASLGRAMAARPGPGCAIMSRAPIGSLQSGQASVGVIDVSAVPVDQLDRRAGVARHPAVAPARERDDDRVEVAALLGQPVLVARRRLLVAHPLEDAVRTSFCSRSASRCRVVPRSALEVLEAPHAEERVAQDQQRPAVADDGESAGDRARHPADVPPAHAGL